MSDSMPPIDSGNARDASAGTLITAPRGQGPAQPSVGQSAAGPQPLPPRRKRRWGRRIAVGLFFLLLLVAGLIGGAPYLLGMPAVRGFALRQANGLIPGKIHLDSTDLSWFSACQIGGLKITDPQDREVISADRISIDGGIAKLARSILNFGSIKLDAPHLTIYLDEHDRVTLPDAFVRAVRDDAAARSESSGELPQPRGEIVLNDAVVRVVRPDGRELEISSLDGRLALDTLNQITGALSVALKSGGQADVEADVRELFAGGALQLDRAQGKVRLVSKQAVPLGPISAFFGPDARVDGDAAFDVSGTWEGGGLKSDFSVNMAGLRTPPAAGGDAIKPLDVEFKGKAAYAERRLTADAAVSSAAGKLRADLEYDNRSPPPPITGERLLSALLTGERIAFPQMKLTGDGKIDLAKLEDAVPGLLRCGGNRRITGGTVEISKLVFEGGDAPSTAGALQVRDLTGQADGKQIHAQPIDCAFDAKIAPGKGLTLQSTELKSAFAQITASGDPTDLKATFTGSLARLKQELGPLLSDQQYELAGELAGTLHVARPSNERVDVGLDLNGDQVRYVSGDRRLELPKATVKHAGYVTLADHKAQRWVIEKADADLGADLAAQVAGWFDVAGGGYHADVTASRMELAGLARHAAALGVQALNGFSGSLTGTLAVEQSATDKPIASSGNLTGRNLTLDGQALSENDAKFDWSGAQIAPDASLIEVASAKLESAVANLTARNVRFCGGESIALGGDIDAAADLAGVLRTVGRLSQWKDVPKLTGRVNWKTRCAATGPAIALKGGGTIEQFTAGEGERQVREERVQFDYDVKLDNKDKRIGVEKLHLASGPLTADVGGSIERFATDCELKLTGKYDAKWESLTTLLHTFAPSMAGVVDIRGTSSSPFQLSGAANQPNAKPAFRGLAGGLEATWASASVLEIPLGVAKLTPSLKDGQLLIAGGPIPVLDGSIELGGMIDFQPGEPTLRVPGTLKLLNRVVITKQLADKLLSRINPIFLHMFAAEGKVSLRVQDWTMPLGDSITGSGSGKGRLDLSQMQVRPEGILKELLAMSAPAERSKDAGKGTKSGARQSPRQGARSGGGGAAPQDAPADSAQGTATGGEKYTVQASAVDFVLKNGRISYDNFALKFPDNFELIFRGSVGFDDAVDLWVGLPVRPELLNRLGVKGPVSEYARLLEDVRIEVPIVGTRQNPKLDFARVDVDKLMKGVLKKAPEKLLDEALKKPPTKALDDIVRGVTGQQGKDVKPAEPSKSREQPAKRRPPAGERKKRK